MNLRLQPDPTASGLHLSPRSIGASSDAAHGCTSPAKRRSRPSESELRPHRSRLMTPPAGPLMSFGSGPPPVPPRRPQSVLVPPILRLWPSARPSVVCSMYPRPRLVLHQCVRSLGPGPRRGCGVQRSAGAAPLPIPAFRRHRQHVSRSHSLPVVGSSATASVLAGAAASGAPPAPLRSRSQPAAASSACIQVALSARCRQQRDDVLQGM